jgi:DNA polymerase-3 subunit delta
VIVKNLGKLKDPDRIALKLASLPESSCLVFIAPSPGESKRKTAISDKFDNAVRKAGVVIQFPSLDAIASAKILSQRAEKLGTPIERPALNLLIDLAGPDLAKLRLELEKLSAFAGVGNRITVSIVELLTPKSPEANVFALVDAVASGNPIPALATLKGMLDTGERADNAAPKIIGLTARQFRMIAQARFLMDARYLPGNVARIPPEVASMLPSDPNLIKELGKRSWLLNKVTQQARNFNADQLNRAFKRILEADLAIKGIEGSVEDARLSLELMLVDLCRIALNRRS